MIPRHSVLPYVGVLQPSDDVITVDGRMKLSPDSDVATVVNDKITVATYNPTIVCRLDQDMLTLQNKSCPCLGNTDKLRIVRTDTTVIALAGDTTLEINDNYQHTRITSAGGSHKVWSSGRSLAGFVLEATRTSDILTITIE